MVKLNDNAGYWLFYVHSRTFVHSNLLRFPRSMGLSASMHFEHHYYWPGPDSV